MTLGGIPPIGAPLDSSGGMPPGSISSSSSYTFSGDYLLDGDNATKMNTNYASDKVNESAIYVINGGHLTLANPTITTALTNIHGNGNNIYYDSNLGSNSWLGGKTYNLANGGKLTPEI